MKKPLTHERQPRSLSASTLLDKKEAVEHKYKVRVPHPCYPQRATACQQTMWPGLGCWPRGSCSWAAVLECFAHVFLPGDVRRGRHCDEERLPADLAHRTGTSARKPSCWPGRSWGRTKSASRANSAPAGPTESITLRDSRHGSDVLPPLVSSTQMVTFRSASCVTSIRLSIRIADLFSKGTRRQGCRFNTAT